MSFLVYIIRVYPFAFWWYNLWKLVNTSMSDCAALRNLNMKTYGVGVFKRNFNFFRISFSWKVKGEHIFRQLPQVHFISFDRISWWSEERILKLLRHYFSLRSTTYKLNSPLKNFWQKEFQFYYCKITFCLLFSKCLFCFLKQIKK